MSCAWVGCDRPANARQVCLMHYKKTLRAGIHPSQPGTRLTILVQQIYAKPSIMDERRPATDGTGASSTATHRRESH